MSSIEQKQQQVETLMRLAPVIPVVIIDNARDAVPMARALVAGGIPTIEVTLRTPAALDAIRAIAAEVEGAVIGAGTVLTVRDLEAARQAGARFAVSPGVSPKLLDAVQRGDDFAGARLSFPEILPGCAGRRHQAARCVGQSATAGALLSYGWHQSRQCAGFSRLAECALCGWLLVDAGGQVGGGGLGRD